MSPDTPTNQTNEALGNEEAANSPEQGTQATPYIKSLSTETVAQPLHIQICEKQEQRIQQEHLHRSQSLNLTFVRMASESAAPPVPYSRLQEITVSVLSFG